VTRAIVLAAGEGTRLRPYTLDRPKCLVPLAGRPLLEWQLDALRAAGIAEISVVTGYMADQIEALGLSTDHNDRYDATNMVASLMCAREHLDGTDDVVIAYGDLVYEPRVVRALLDSDAPASITVDRSWRQLWELRMEDPLGDAETLRLDYADNVVELGREPQCISDIEAQYMGLIALRAGFVRQFVATWDGLDPAGPYEGRDRDNMYMTSFLQHLIEHVTPIRAVVVEGGWLEVDTTEDLEIYDSLHERGMLGRYCTLVGG
jgi:choline kinase